MFVFTFFLLGQYLTVYDNIFYIYVGGRHQIAIKYDTLMFLYFSTEDRKLIYNYVYTPFSPYLSLS